MISWAETDEPGYASAQTAPRLAGSLWVMDMKMRKVLGGLALIAVAMAGVYAVAATTASSLAAGFSTDEAASRAQIAGFAAVLKRDSAAHRAARAKCDLLARVKKNVCYAEADARHSLKLSSAL